MARLFVYAAFSFLSFSEVTTIALFHRTKKKASSPPAEDATMVIVFDDMDGRNGETLEKILLLWCRFVAFEFNFQTLASNVSIKANG